MTVSTPLTEHFTLEEFTRSDKARELRINNTPAPAIVANLRRLAKFNELVRLELKGAAMVISSGYRCPALNRAVGGAAIITDYSGDADAIMVALLAWVEVHQRDLLDNADLRKTGIGFDVDFNNHQTIDLSIKLTLTERVVVKRGNDGRLDVRHPAEPQLTPGYTDQFWQAYAGNSLIAEWHTPADPQ
ncbi:phage tail protein [Collimonas sp. H4R21]|uniref:Phage tail protein n=1 Tax=Collimonas rhizosphaerae TaxID=3126357 RepID=A0ABU9PUF8_9BURK